MNYNKFINLTHFYSKKPIDRICSSVLLGLETDCHRFQTTEESSSLKQIAVIFNVVNKMCSFHTPPTLFIIFYFIFLILGLMMENNDLLWNSFSISMTKNWMNPLTSFPENVRKWWLTTWDQVIKIQPVSSPEKAVCPLKKPKCSNNFYSCFYRSFRHVIKQHIVVPLNYQLFCNVELCSKEDFAIKAMWCLNV